MAKYVSCKYVKRLLKGNVITNVRLSDYQMLIFDNKKTVHFLRDGSLLMRYFDESKPYTFHGVKTNKMREYIRSLINL